MELILACVCVHLLLIGLYLRRIALALEYKNEDDEKGGAE